MATEPRTESPEHSAPPASTDPVGRRILVVEDTSVNQLAARLLLEQLGYQVDLAANGRTALEVCATQAYSLILMDCYMPELDGFATTAALRKAEGSLRHTPIVALTASAGAAEREQCLAAGMDDFLTKPITPESLAAVMARWLTPLTPKAPVVFDPQVLARSLGAQYTPGSSLQRKLIAVFISDTNPKIAAIETAITHGAWAEAGRLAHRIRGSSAQLGLTALEQLCTTIEAAAQTNTSTALQHAGAALRSTYDTALAQLQAYSDPRMKDADGC